MAQINIEVDTEKQTVSASVDGKKVKESLTDIYISTEYSGYFGISMNSREEVDGVRKYTTITASMGKYPDAYASTEYVGMFETNKDYTVEDIITALFGTKHK